MRAGFGTGAGTVAANSALARPVAAAPIAVPGDPGAIWDAINSAVDGGLVLVADGFFAEAIVVVLKLRPSTAAGCTRTARPATAGLFRPGILLFQGRSS